MSLFERKIRPAFITPPAETPPTVTAEARIAELDRKLTAIALIPRGQRTENLLWQENRLLDLRNAIRPGRPRPVPVIPGRST
jgi:hypothetical protein